MGSGFRNNSELGHSELPARQNLSNVARIGDYIRLTGLKPVVGLLAILGKPTWRVRSSDCLPNANNALCSLINCLLVSFWTCRRSSLYHQVGRPYSQIRPRLAHSLHLGVKISHFTFLNEQVQHPSRKFSEGLADLKELAYLHYFSGHRCCIRRCLRCFVSGWVAQSSMDCETAVDVGRNPTEQTIGRV